MSLNPIPQPVRQRVLIPKAPILTLAGGKLICLDTEGEIETILPDKARKIIYETPPIVCHALRIANYLKISPFPAFDVLELFAFIKPGEFCVPTVAGISGALSLFEPASPEDQCRTLRDCIRHLLSDLATTEDKGDIAGLAAFMGNFDAVQGEENNGWLWARPVLAALGRLDPPPARGDMKSALRVWDRLPEWAVHAPEAPAHHHAVDTDEVQERLRKLLHRQRKEDRPQQQAYAKALLHAFSPRNDEETTHTVMAEAGTGTGKTLGYLAPATLWAEKNGAAVWVSTYTRNLQRQIDTELDKLYDDPIEKSRRIVTRKGRENYLCLLNLEDAAQSVGVMAADNNRIAQGLMTRWAAVTRDGDLGGADFPGWMAGLIGMSRVYNLADRRGECIYAGCPHFNKCFVEKSIRKAKRADIVIANHALVMHQTSVTGPDDDLPARYIFDEGHHLFEAADSAFDMQLNGQWTADLRRWLMGTEGGSRSRARGLKKRIEDLVIEDEGAKKDLDAVLEAARALPGQNWRQRLSDKSPKGACEQFLLFCGEQVYARAGETGGFYSLETPLQPTTPELVTAAAALRNDLRQLQKPMLALSAKLLQMLIDQPETLDTAARERLRFSATSLQRRAQYVVGAWIDMLDTLVAGKSPTETVDWLEVTRADGKDSDTGFYRYYVDPAKEFAQRLKPHAHGAIITSASLRDIAENDPEGWNSARRRTGIAELAPRTDEAQYFHTPSPFDYAARTKIFVVSDVDKTATAETSAAMRALFMAAGGGALGLFTSVQRLRAVHTKIHAPLADAGIDLLAQHVDPLDTGTLIDIFRAEENACLLGTDATRDGIDVPGRSLRLVVYDRVPWPRPTILHKARREYFGRGYDDMLTRFKLKQAYGRLIRRDNDRGVFVMLESALPTRLTTAFPQGVEIERRGLKEVIEITTEFLK